jgi:hypothetical protein
MGKLHDIEVDDYYAECVGPPDLMMLDHEFARVSSDIAYWGEKYAEAYEEAAMAKLEMEETQARAYLLVKETTTTRMSIPEIEALVATDQLVRDARIRNIEADAKKVKMKGRVQAVLSRREMLVSLGAHVRKEMDGDPMIRAAYQQRKNEIYGGG